MSRPASEYRGARRNEWRKMNRLVGISWADFQKRFPIKRRQRVGKKAAEARQAARSAA